MVSEPASKRDSTVVTRFLWMIFAPFEFIAMILIGVPLYLVWSVLLYLDALRGLFDGAVTVLVLRFRVGRIAHAPDEEKAAAPFSYPRRAATGKGQKRLASWLN
jgi:hypothetical protein